jgi:hypothetical protein
LAGSRARDGALRRPAPLKFSTRGDYFNASDAAIENANECWDAICNKNRLLQDRVRRPSLVIALHTTPATPTRANQDEGETKMAKKTLKKAKKIEATKPLMVPIGKR